MNGFQGMVRIHSISDNRTWLEYHVTCHKLKQTDYAKSSDFDSVRQAFNYTIKFV